MLPQDQVNKWLVLAIMCLLTVMLNIDATAVNLAIPVISHEFHAQLSTMQWVMNVFLLASAAFQIVGGRFGDVLGHAKTFNYGTLLFVVASAMAGFSHGSGLLLAGRALQGVSMGIAYPMTLAIVFRIFPKNLQGTAMGVIMGVMGISLAIGPTIGAAFVEYSTWHWIFFVNIPIGLVTLLLSWRYCPLDVSVGSLKDIDYIGASLLILGLTGIILSLNQVQNWGFGSGLFIGILCAGVAVIGILYFVEKLISQPVLDFSLFKIAKFSAYNFIRIMSQVIFLPLLFVIPLYLVNVVEFTPMHAGIIMLALTIIVGIASPCAGPWVDRAGAKLPTIISFIFTGVGCYLLTLLDPKPQIIMLTIGLALNGIGIGIGFVSTTTGALAPVPEDKTGVATGIFFTVIWASCAFAVAVAGTVIASLSKSSLFESLYKLGLQYTSSQSEVLVRTARGLIPASSLNNYVLPGHSAEVIESTKQAFITGFHGVAWMLVVASGIGLVLTLLTRHHVVRNGEAPPAI